MVLFASKWAMNRNWYLNEWPHCHHTPNTQGMKQYWPHRAKRHEQDAPQKADLPTYTTEKCAHFLLLRSKSRDITIIIIGLPSQLCNVKIITDPQQSLVHIRSQTGMTYSTVSEFVETLYGMLSLIYPYSLIYLFIKLLLFPLFSKHGVGILCTVLRH